MMIYFKVVVFFQGVNFRDLLGVRVRSDNKVEWDFDIKRVLLFLGKLLVRYVFFFFFVIKV